MTLGKTVRPLEKFTFNYFGNDIIVQLFLYRRSVSRIGDWQRCLIFNEANFLEGNLDKQTFKKALEIIGRNDLATKLEIYVAAGK